VDSVNIGSLACRFVVVHQDEIRVSRNFGDDRQRSIRKLGPERYPLFVVTVSWESQVGLEVLFDHLYDRILRCGAHQLLRDLSALKQKETGYAAYSVPSCDPLVFVNV
jgi:hypothetical protein